MIDIAKKLLALNLVPISCNNKKIPIKKQWPKLTSDTALKNIVDDVNLGVLTGKISKVTVIDVDVKDNGLATWNMLTKKHGAIKNTPVVKTGSGGYHYYFKYNDKLKSDSKVVVYNDTNVGIDIKNDGGYVVCPPSINAEGNKYKWLKTFDKYKPIEIPDWFFEYLKTTKKQHKKEAIMNGGKKGQKPESEMEASDCVNLYDKGHITTLLNTLSQQRVDNYSSWIEVGMALYNSESKSNEFFGLWRDWSKKSGKYEEGTCEIKWLSFSKAEDGLTIASIHHWAKQDNPTAYDKYKKEECIHKFIEDNKDNISVDGDLEVSNILSNPVKCMADIGNKYCLVSKNEHDIPMNFVEFVKNNGAYIACKHGDCYGKMLKDKIFQVDDKMMQILFDGKTVNINIAKHIHNNFGGTTNDDPEVLICDNYEIFEDVELNGLVMESLNNTDHDIAKVLWYLYKNEFNCTKDKKWYAFEKHKWIQNDVRLRELISNELPKHYKIVLKYYRNLAKDTPSKELNYKIGNITQLIKSLKKASNKNNIVHEANDIFYANNEDFEEKLDGNSYLVGFKNGVYDISEHIFRDGKHDDYITLSTGYDYVPTYTEHKKNLDKFLEDIQPNEIERNYMLTYFSLALVGINTHEIIGILEGSGRNGKSKIAELLGITLGDYLATISASLLTKEQPSANTPRPELLLLKNKRFVIASEPEANQKLNAAFIKLLTGNDPVTARNLYDNEVISFIPKFNLALLCNDVPPFDKNDDAIWARARCIEFPIKFVPNPEGENQKQIDYKLKEKLVKWKQDFMLLLIEKYKEFEKNGLVTTPNIMKFTRQTKENNDIFKQYLDERTEKSDKHIHTSTLYDDFKTWFVMNNPKSKIPSNREFIKEIKKYHEIDHVRVDKIISTGFKNLTIL